MAEEEEIKHRGPLTENVNGLAWMSITVDDAKAVGLDPAKLTGAEVISKFREFVEEATGKTLPERERGIGKTSQSKKAAEVMKVDAELLTGGNYNRIMAENPALAKQIASLLTKLPKKVKRAKKVKKE